MTERDKETTDAFVKSQRALHPRVAAEIAETRRRIREDRPGTAEDVNELLEVIEAHLFEPGLDASEIRRRVEPTSQTLWRFRQRLGGGLAAYLERRRLETVHRLVADSEVPLAEIAGGLGFRSPEVLSKWFKRRTHLSPKTLRRESAPPKKTAGDALPEPCEINASFWRRALLGALHLEDVRRLFEHLRQRYPQAFERGRKR